MTGSGLQKITAAARNHVRSSKGPRRCAPHDTYARTFDFVLHEGLNMLAKLALHTAELIRFGAAESVQAVH